MTVADSDHGTATGVELSVGERMDEATSVK
jgi:hypothetical protein